MIYNEGKDLDEHSFIMMEAGQFYRMGYTDKTINATNLLLIKVVLKCFTDLNIILKMIM